MGIFQQFPYTNFHEMNLDQLIKIMREMQDEWAATKAEWATYKDFIDNYFNNLDVSAEVLAALRVMANTGELNTIIDPVIIDEVAEWLNEHITPTTPAIDNTLSIEGAAADAKATGDAIDALHDEFYYELGSDPDATPITSWVNGYYIQTNTSPVDINDPQPLAAYRYAVVDCVVGDVFTINGRGGTSPRLWAFIDADGNVRTASGGDVTGDNLVITAPTLSAKLIINDKDKTGTCYKGIFKTINEKIDDLQNGEVNAVDYTSVLKNGYIETAKAAGTVIDLTNINSTTAYKYCIIPVRKNDTLLITGTGAIGARLWAFIDESNKINSTALTSESYVNGAISSPVNGKCIINVVSANPYSITHITNGIAVKKAITTITDQMAFYMRSNYNIRYANTCQQIKMSNYTDNPQNVHPKVLYFPTGLFDHKYWMAYTPYPNGHTEYENPSVAYSDDGVTWTNYAHNPLAVRVNNNTVNYNSDTHLVYNNDQLECWWRFVNETNNVEIIYRRTSTDGTHWNPAEEIMRHQTTGSLLSPAVMFLNNKYVMWCVNAETTPHIEYWEGDGTAANWAKVRDIDLTYNYDNISYMPWHLDVIYNDNKYIAVIMCKDNITSSHDTAWTLFISTSTDNITYSTPECIMLGNPESWDMLLYRSSIVYVDNEYVIYYSARNAAGKYGFGITRSKTLNKFVGLNKDID